jgi:uncharacterized membrane protein
MPPNPHPLVVHFPIALLTASVFFEIVAYWSRKEVFEKVAKWNLASGVLAGIAAVVSGLLAEESVPQFPVIHEIVERHETLAFVTLGVFAILFLWRFLKGGKFFARWRAFYLALAVIGILILGATAYYGGELVYKFGVGVPSQPWWQK